MASTIGSSSTQVFLSSLTEPQRVLVAFQQILIMSEHSKATFKKLGTNNVEEVYQKEIEGGNDSWKNGSNFRLCFDSLYKMQVAAISAKYFSKNTEYKTLEIGSGYLWKDNKSYLEHSLPSGYQFTITHSDINKKIVDDAHAKIPKHKFLHLNSAEMNKSFKGSSLDAVMASCCLDTLNAVNLTKTLQQIVDSLKEGGIFFHISDLIPFYSTLVGHYSEQDSIMFPWMNKEPCIDGIQLVSKKECDDFILKHAKDRAAEVEFLKAYIKLPKQVRAMIVNNITAFSVLTESISNWVKRTFGENREEIKNTDFFEKRLLDAVKGLHCEVMQCGPSIQTEDTQKIEVDPDDSNFMGSSHGKITMKKISLPDGVIRKISQVHAFVIRKNTVSENS